jgi:hypothetical protein
MTDPVLSFPTHNGRFYRRGPDSNVIVPSITNIKGVKHIPLGGAAAKKCAAYAADNWDRLGSLTRDERYNLVREAWFAHDPVGPSAIGDIVHSFIDRFVKGEPAASVRDNWLDEKNPAVKDSPRTAQNMWRQFLGWVDQYRPEFVKSEFTVWSDTYNYAGSADWWAYFKTDGGGKAAALVDSKSGVRIYPDVALQLAALAKADFILNDDGTQEPMPQFERFGALHIRPMSCQLVPVFHIGEAFQAFLALKTVFDWQANYQSITLGSSPKIKTPVGNSQ